MIGNLAVLPFEEIHRDVNFRMENCYVYLPALIAVSCDGIRILTH